MKVILVDAWNTLVKENKLDVNIYKILEKFTNEKIILTNANNEEQIKYGIVNMPYKVFSLNHKPNKTDPNYYKKMINKLNLQIDNIIYIEHNIDAVNSALSLGIRTFHYKPNDNENLIYEFINNNC